MTTRLIETARTNRIKALAYLQAKKARVSEDSQIICLKTMREQLQPKPVFLTRRAPSMQERIAA